jgi:hypothetical protein
MHDKGHYYALNRGRAFMENSEAANVVVEAMDLLTASRSPLNCNTVPDTAIKILSRTSKDANGHIVDDLSGRIYRAIAEMRDRGEIDAPDDILKPWGLLKRPHSDDPNE